MHYIYTIYKLVFSKILISKLENIFLQMFLKNDCILKKIFSNLSIKKKIINYIYVNCFITYLNWVIFIWYGIHKSYIYLYLMTNFNRIKILHKYELILFIFWEEYWIEHLNSYQTCLKLNLSSNNYLKIIHKFENT